MEVTAGRHDAMCLRGLPTENLGSPLNQQRSGNIQVHGGYSRILSAGIIVGIHAAPIGSIMTSKITLSLLRQAVLTFYSNKDMLLIIFEVRLLNSHLSEIIPRLLCGLRHR